MNSLVKNLVYLTAIVFLFAPSAIADNKPLWTDICPVGMENAVYKEIQWFWPEGTKSVQEIYNFWAKKRIEFENLIVLCDTRTEDYKDACYTNVKKIILSNVDIHNTNIQNKNISKQLWKDKTFSSGVNFNF